MNSGRLAISAALAGIVAAFTVSATSIAAPQTTRPAPTVNMYVTLSDQTITVKSFQRTGRTASGPLRRVSSKAITRGNVLNIQIHNIGKKVHNFTLFGFTRVVPPSGTAHLFTAAITRGTYVYGSTRDKGTSLKGRLRVI